ncbi:FOG: TPR repeat [Methyloceanibacter caenitepidi]|uniref:FOG: TPR repeat n=2 Tax=Methyloceanibacter caenitepidi TaxID=1384459 RepID=A0A0A8K1U2_9HYPH|nr:FOG: TPR repeat [Methyloceanibacter caenitepidi]
MKTPDSGRMGKWALRSVLLIAILAAPTAYSEVVATKPETTGAQTLLGNYLAGRIARHNNDIEAAAKFYTRALAADPTNEAILEQAFLLEARAGHWERATELAKELVKVEPSHRFAQFLLAINAFKAGDYKKAEEHFSEARQGPTVDPTSTLARAWTQEAQGEHSEAFDTLDALSTANWANFYLLYHRALIADVAGRHQLASKSYDAAFKRNPRTLRVVDAYARHAARGNRKDLAIAALKLHMAKTLPHPITEALLKDIENGGTPELVVSNPSEGLAEVFYGIGSVAVGEGNLETGTQYLKFALLLKPDFPLAEVALAEAYSEAEKYEDEIAAFENVPESSPLWLNVQIQKAFALASLERIDDAKAVLEKIIAENPDDIRPLDALGSILRSKERHEEAREYYTRAIDLVDKPTQRNWALYYARGVTNERLKDWPAAEADFKKALELNPDESLILNYLGYSWVDQGMNLDQAMDYIRKAVSLKPDDGYYVDSLGWAYYRLGKMPQAVEQLERAVELRPDDPIINDHLGDAYWRVGRTLEAKYQWYQSMSLEPEDDLKEMLTKKIASGLDAATATDSKSEMVEAKRNTSH